MKYLANVTTIRLITDKCVGCGKCADVCPHGVFVVEGGKAAITDRDKCMECGACATNCEFGAIEVESGVGCAAAIINSIIYGGEPSCDCTGSSGCCG
ncbi:MAG: 4Fe-4S binding protein [Nitrospirae bacterium]|nr:4Fe-4S binding protein [Nitrospirota bacterium]